MTNWPNLPHSMGQKLTCCGFYSFEAHHSLFFHVLYYSAPNEELTQKDPAGKLLAESDLFFSKTQKLKQISESQNSGPSFNLERTSYALPDIDEGTYGGMS